MVFALVVLKNKLMNLIKKIDTIFYSCYLFTVVNPS